MALIETPPPDGNGMAGKSFSECLKYNASKLGKEFITPKKGDDDGSDS